MYMSKMTLKPQAWCAGVHCLHVHVQDDFETTVAVANTKQMTVGCDLTWDNVTVYERENVVL